MRNADARCAHARAAQLHSPMQRALAQLLPIQVMKTRLLLLSKPGSRLFKQRLRSACLKNTPGPGQSQDLHAFHCSLVPVQAAARPRAGMRHAALDAQRRLEHGVGDIQHLKSVCRRCSHH